MTRATVWVVGGWRHADFAEAIAWLNGAAHGERFDDVAAALASLRLHPPPCDPTAILLAQTHPGQMDEQHIKRLHAAVPLARLVALVGPWCEGEMRSGRPLSGIVRVPWRAWHGRLPQELGLPHRRENGAGLLPRTATEAERVEASIKRLADSRQFGGTAAIYTNHRATFDALADALQRLGVSAVWRCGAEHSPQAVQLIICDGWEQIPPTSTDLPPRLLLLHFPRPEDLCRAESLGIAAVVAQPLLLADLAAALDPLIAAPR